MSASWSAGNGAMCDTALFLDLSLHAVLIQGTIDRRDGVAESITLSSRLFGRFNTFDATPALATFGDNLPHFLNGVMFSTVVAVGGISRHGRYYSANDV